MQALAVVVLTVVYLGVAVTPCAPSRAGEPELRPAAAASGPSAPGTHASSQRGTESPEGPSHPHAGRGSEHGASSQPPSRVHAHGRHVEEHGASVRSPSHAPSHAQAQAGHSGHAPPGDAARHAPHHGQTGHGEHASQPAAQRAASSSDADLELVPRCGCGCDARGLKAAQGGKLGPSILPTRSDPPHVGGAAAMALFDVPGARAAEGSCEPIPI